MSATLSNIAVEPTAGSPALAAPAHRERYAVPGFDSCVYKRILTCALLVGPEKSGANFQDRGFDFAFASPIFAGPTLEREDTRQDYGERRIIAIGLAADLELTVCYTDRVDASGVVDRRIISARRSNRRERKAYREAVRGR